MSCSSRPGSARPFVLVGHSYGGFVVRLLADRRPQDVAGVVLLDVTNETAELGGVARLAARLQLGTARFLARIGVIRLLGGAAVDEHDPAAARDNSPVVYGAGTYAAALAELRAFDETLRQVRPTLVPGRFGNRSVTIVSAGSTEPADQEHHKLLATLSARGEWLMAEGAGHVIQADRRDFVVTLIDRVRRSA
jgi:pimeloyl-ACP methyl ester carboxylesterase